MLQSYQKRDIDEERTSSKRPPRVLLSLIDQLHPTIVKEISERSMSLKSSVKVPMVLLVWSVGIFSAVNLSLFKFFGEILSQNDFWKMPVLALALLVFGLAGAIIQIVTLNVTMRYYNNLDIMPLLQAFILTMMLLTGWTLLDESKYYTSLEMLGLLGAGCFIFSGIKIITMKTSVIATLKKTEPIDETIVDSATSATDIDLDSGSDVTKKEETSLRAK